MSEEEEVVRFAAHKSMRFDDLVKTYSGVLDEADQALLERSISSSLPLPGLPDGLAAYVSYGDHHDPIPPDDLTEIPSRELGKLFSYMQQWTNYISSEVTRAQCLLLVQERHHKVAKASIAIFYREERNVPAGLVDEYVSTDARFVEIDAAYLKLKVFVMTSEDRFDQYRRILNVISREQTRRAQELERQIHDEFGGKPSPRKAGARSERADEMPFRTR